MEGLKGPDLAALCSCHYKRSAFSSVCVMPSSAACGAEKPVTPHLNIHEVKRFQLLEIAADINCTPNDLAVTG